MILIFLSVFALVLLYAIQSANAKLCRIRNVNTGERAPGYNYFRTLYNKVYKRYTHSIAGILLSQSEELGPFYYSYLFNPTVTIADPLLIKEVLKKVIYFPKISLQNEGNLHLRRLLELEKKFIGTKGITRMNSDAWRHQRSLLNVVFLSNKELFEPMVKNVKLVLSKWDPGREVKIGKDLKKMAIDIIGECIFGCNFEKCPLTDYNFVMSNISSPIRFLVPFYSDLPLPVNWKLKNCINEFDAYCWKIINEAKQKNFAEDQKRSLIDLMIAGSKNCENGMSDQEIHDNVCLLFGSIEGSETMLTWIIGMLVTHPEIQKKARREVFETIPGDLTFDDLKHVEYVEWIIKEALRLYPPLPIIERRETACDIVLGEWFIPAKTHLQLDIITCLRDPKIWRDPLEFRPERWLYENITKEQRAAWMPFSYGPRVCVAKSFALMQLKIFLVYLLKYFSEFKMANGSVLQVKTPSVSNLYNLDSDKIKIVFTKE